MFENIYLEVEKIIMDDINLNSNQIGLVEGFFSLHNIDIDLIQKEVEISGYDKYKGLEYSFFYNYGLKKGRIQYINDEISYFNLNS